MSFKPFAQIKVPLGDLEGMDPIDVRQQLINLAAETWPDERLAIWFNEATQSWRIGPESRGTEPPNGDQI